MHWHLPKRVVAGVLLTLMVAAACADADDDAATTSAPAAGEVTSAEDAPAGETARGTVAITAVNYAFEGVPATVAAGSQLTLTNAADDEVHEIVAIRIPDGERRPVTELMALPEAELESILPPGPPALVLVAPPSEEGFPALGDGTVAEPGRYALVCFIPTGADPEEFLAAAQAAGDGPPQVEGGPPHFTQGMVAEVTVR